MANPTANSQISSKQNSSETFAYAEGSGVSAPWSALLLTLKLVCLQAEDNSFQPILPEEDIAQIYRRILDTEIEVAGGNQAQSSSNAGKPGSSAQNLKLAAAMGLTQLMLPFRLVCPLLP